MAAPARVLDNSSESVFLSHKVSLFFATNKKKVVIQARDSSRYDGNLRKQNILQLQRSVLGTEQKNLSRFQVELLQLFREEHESCSFLFWRIK